MTNAFTSRLNKKQAIAVLIWFPIHIIGLPYLFAALWQFGLIDLIAANVLVYAVGAAYMLLVLHRFFRKEFDTLCDRPLRVLVLVLGAYWLARFGEALISLLFQYLSITDSNANNEAVIAMTKESFGPTAAMAVVLGPIVEESLFRAGIFGLLRRKSRFWAYALSMLAFGLYHVWQSALYDPRQLLLLVQYLPSAFALAYVYDRSDSIWSSIVLHALTNGVSMLAVSAL